MRTAQDIVADYRKRGYSEERIRALANNRPEPIRSEILALLTIADSSELTTTPAAATGGDVMAETGAEAEDVVAAAEDASVPRAGDWKLDSDFVRQVHANLASIQVEHLSADEFYARQEDGAKAAAENALPSSSFMTADSSPAAGTVKTEVDSGVIEPAAATADTAPESSEDTGAVGEMGEIWPQPETGEAEVMPPLAAAAEHAFSAALQDGDNVLDLAALGDTKAGQRSLDVIRQTLDEDPELAATVQEVDNKIIFLTPPYAMEEVAAADEESKLIEFPAEMVEAYEAIRAAQSNIAVAASPADTQQVSVSENPVNAEGFSPEGEINRLRNWLTELEDALKLKNLEAQNLIQKLNERDETLAVQNRELEELRRALEAEKAQRGTDSALTEAYQAAQAELRSLSTQFAEMQREYNELASTTLPELLKDKEDLVALLEEQTAVKASVESALGQCRRRLGYSYLVAASAALLALLLPLFHTISVANREEEWNKVRETLIADADQAKRLLRSSEEKSSSLGMQLANVKREFASERERLLRKNADLAKRVEEQAQNLVALKTELAAARPAAAGDMPSPQMSAPRNDGIVNLSETRWALRQSSASSGAGRDIKTRSAIVKAGDGLIRFLQRECGTYNDALAAWVTKANNLKYNRQGEPILQPDQALLVPVDPRAIDAAAQAPSAARQHSN